MKKLSDEEQAKKWVNELANGDRPVMDVLSEIFPPGSASNSTEDKEGEKMNDEKKLERINFWDSGPSEDIYSGFSTFIKCLKCRKVTEIGSCKNCGEDEWEQYYAIDGVLIMCTKCEHSVGHFRCECGCDNPVTKTLYKEIKENSSDSSGCFIATAAFHSNNAPEVIFLRNYRDTVLLKTFCGKVFIGMYYKISPYVASMINKSSHLRELTIILIKRLISILEQK